MPEAFTDPLKGKLQEVLGLALALALTGVLLLIVAVAVAEHAPCVTVTVYVPPATLLRFWVVAPLLHV